MDANWKKKTKLSKFKATASYILHIKFIFSRIQIFNNIFIHGVLLLFEAFARFKYNI